MEKQSTIDNQPSTINKTPELRFEGFTEDWKEENLGLLAEFTKGQGYSKNDLRATGSPIILYGRLYTNYQTVIDEVDTYTDAQENSYYSSGGEVIVPASGETQEDIVRASVVTKTNIILGGDLNIVMPNESIDSNFLALTISNGRVYHDLVKKAQGKSVVHIRNGDLKEALIPYPKKKEQKQIGSFFKNIDELITKHQKKHNRLVTLKKSMLEKMFPKEGQAVPEIRFKGFEGEWKPFKLEEKVDFFSGLTYSPSNIVKEQGTLVLRSSNVKNGEIALSDNVYVDSTVVNSSNVKKCDIIVVVRNGSRSLIGKHAQIKSEMEATVIGAFMTGIRSNHSTFVNALLDTSHFYLEIEKNLGATINQITTGAFKKMEFYFPKSDEQIKIGEYFQNIDKLIFNYKKQLQKLKNFKQSLSEKMFV